MAGVGCDRRPHQRTQTFLRTFAVSIASYLTLKRQKATANHCLHSHLVSIEKCCVLNSVSKWDFPRLNWASLTSWR